MTKDRGAITLPAPDDEEVSLARAVLCKHDGIAALAAACEARRSRGAETLGIEESLDLERLTVAGYERALANRRRELRGAGRDGRK